MKRASTTTWAPDARQLQTAHHRRTAPTAAPPAEPRPRFVAPTLSGPERVIVGGRLYMLPTGVRVEHSADLRVAYVMHARRVHVLARQGELVGLPRQVIDAIVAEHFT